MGATVKTAKAYQDDVELKMDFKSKGYVSIAGGITPELLREARDSLATGIERFLKCKRGGEPAESFIDRSIIDLNASRQGQETLFAMHTSLRRLSPFYALAAESARLASRLVGQEGLFSVIASGFMLGLPDDSRLAYDFHQESSYMVGADDIMNCHFPFLRPSSIQNGTMSALEGSHVEGPLPARRIKNSENSYTDFIPENLDELKGRYSEVAFHLELGDVVYFHKDLVHKSNPNMSSALRPPVVIRLTEDLTYKF